MASTTGNGHGGRRRNSGRKRKFGDEKDRKEAKKEWHRCHKRIYLEKDIFQSWLQMKFITGFEARSDSAFAAYLLSQEVRRTSSIEISNVLPSSNFTKRRKASKPRKHVIKQSEEGSIQLISAKSSDLPAVVNEPTIAAPDAQGSQLTSTSTPDLTSVEGSSNPTNLTTPHGKTNNCTTLTGEQHNSSQMHGAGTIEIQVLLQ